jgi:hypothetical protein
MIRQMVSLVLASTFVLNLGMVAQAKKSAQQSSSKAEALKEKAMGITPGTMVEVRLLSKEKVRGRIVDLTTEGFSLETGEGAGIQKRSLSFLEMKSIKEVSAEAKGHRVVMYTIFVVGALAALAVILIASGEASK